MQPQVTRFPYDAARRKLKKAQEKGRAKGLKIGRNIGEDALALGPTSAARKHRVSQSTASYYLCKLQQPGFHSGAWGGFR